MYKFPMLFRRPPVPKTRFVFGYCPNLTDPNATLIEVGVLHLEGERFAGFHWRVDYNDMGLDPMVLGIFRIWPDSMQNLVEQWPAFRDRNVPPHIKQTDPDNILDYIVETLARSSFPVLRVERD